MMLHRYNSPHRFMQVVTYRLEAEHLTCVSAEGLISDSISCVRDP